MSSVFAKISTTHKNQRRYCDIFTICADMYFYYNAMV